MPYIQVQVHIPERLEAALNREATRLSLSRTRWITALVEHRLSGALQFPREAELAIIQIRTELRRMRGQIARIEANPLGRDNQALAAELAVVRQELASLVRSIDAAFAASGRYWRGS